jgi:hypothetical protein
MHLPQVNAIRESKVADKCSIHTKIRIRAFCVRAILHSMCSAGAVIVGSITAYPFVQQMIVQIGMHVFLNYNTWDQQLILMFADQMEIDELERANNPPPAPVRRCVSVDGCVGVFVGVCVCA